ncbi:UDP-glucose/GDP-mannose dehydrogenase family protein [Clostridium sp. DJ247]|uniref:UDP-glucose dehydrogenase family protein n=1 Tax=Clostridium sp. DJ247 TaxID=2726188 RepID=UPI001625183A|nr:UDP-glucose/GDP-mannose dehydrogenase family protein [Clostridium sp. DJ247]MBC2580056.1 UDP-glucose/GDP-mannose dehydrogenase family protein [Clostridium sp. DJ247]
MSKIATIGSGYVGLVTGTCLSDFGWQVTCVDNNQHMVEKLNSGEATIYEPGLEDLLKRNIYYRRVNFTIDIKKAIEENDVIFIAVGTPQQEDGSADLTNVLEVANEIGNYINEYKVIVNKSTVPIGTGQKVKKIIGEAIRKRGLNIEYDVVSNPEFLRQGSAIQDFTHADRVVIGAESQRAIEIMKEVYRVLYINETPFLITNIETAELIKYASNAFLATKISFVNELSELCEKVGANIQQVAKGMGMDGRIGSKFLHAGPGYGGSCFPKDTRSLVSIGNEYNCNMGIIKATIAANEKQKLRMVDKITSEIGNLDGRVFGILGLAFKNNTDDMREAPSITILSELAKTGAKFKVYDPKAMEKASDKLQHINEHILKYCKDEYDTCHDVDAVIIITEWNQFRSLDLDRIKASMRGEYFFDLRNIYPKEFVLEKGFKYISIGR